MCKYSFLLCAFAILLSACAMNVNSNLKVDSRSYNIIEEGKSTAMDVERILGPKYLYSFGFKPQYPQFNGKRVMVYDAGSSMEGNWVPFAQALPVQKTLVIVLDDNNMVIDKEMLSEQGGLPPF